MRLSKRLESIASFIPRNSIVADIGTDHGYIPRYLIENNISKMIIASDVSQGSLNKTINYIEEYRMGDKIIPRLGDGLEVIKKFEVDTVVIAGMGGLLIRDILDKDKELTNSINNFILQPMIAAKELREYLNKNDFVIIDEDLVKEDDKFYEIMLVKKGKELIEKDIYFDISKKLIHKNHRLLKEFLQYKINSIKEILSKLTDQSSEKSLLRYDELNKLLIDYKEVMDKIEG
jgi:tRNA (adenine22-N1)-methyltransferase